MGDLADRIIASYRTKLFKARQANPVGWDVIEAAIREAVEEELGMAGLAPEPRSASKPVITGDSPTGKASRGES